MSTIHKPKKSAVSIEKRVAQHEKKERAKEDADIKKEAEDKAQEEEESLESVTDPRVMAHYNDAAKIANAALKLAETLCVEGAVIHDICTKVNAYITEECGKVFKGKYNYEKGIAFPCCISLNNCCGYYSPLADDKTAIKKGDLVKIQLGAHISGFVAEVANTIVIGEAATGDKQKLIEAGYLALKEAVTKLEIGVNTADISAAIDAVCKKYDVKPFENIISRNMERYVIDGQKFILNVLPKSPSDHLTIEANEVWNLEIQLTSGAAKPIERDTRTTVFKRNVEESYLLKMKASQTTFREINDKYPTFPFAISMLENEAKAKLGLVEMTKHSLVDAYNVVYEKTGNVSQFKATVIITEKGKVLLTPIDEPATLKK
ncbi:proliferation-associated protein 2G4, putative [Entamoeba invadens IP1]|uniref:Proliferation-associated protein 2G4, putative n=1 Tax=Entamoeba invadens IP1 TaxID=370355 RepID=A0A0A1U5N1_ENTIV|nr:proliferation-associated protein 2G4, putative [Entamoeba invadens IP1]ELP88165.1 proliferation-associated protein 2G4, putative [Entamoeba invadens IP1]|eukprot:XP_004254936.1 proliferation-associated protein 2G4, putative [Entamoeba invadens IP1]